MHMICGVLVMEDIPISNHGGQESLSSANKQLQKTGRPIACQDNRAGYTRPQRAVPYRKRDRTVFQLQQTPSLSHIATMVKVADSNNIFYVHIIRNS